MAETTARHIRVLIVDDDDIIAEILSELVSDQERSVEICHDGLEAIERIQKDAFDLIIVDLIMPRVGGLDVLKYVKKINPETIVIIITGYASLETAMTAIKEGAYDYIRKPCKLAEMKVVVDRATDKIRLDRENRDLIEKLQTIYQNMMVSKVEQNDAPEKTADINFYSSDRAGLHHLFSSHPTSDSYIEKLHALSSLRESGMLTAHEYTRFKEHLLKDVDSRGSQTRASNNG